MNYTPINIQKKFSFFSDHFAPKIIAQMNSGVEWTAEDNVWI